MIRPAVAIALASCVAALTAAASNAAADQAPAAQTAPDRAAQEATVNTLCGACHEVNVIEGPFRLPAEWDETIGRMKSFGATGSADQFAEVRTYLLWRFGRANVNSALASDLAPVLDITSEVADAVVKSRTDNGKLASLDDLKKVPGMDPAKVDARKARLVF
jgi:competence protein ComEA